MLTCLGTVLLVIAAAWVVGWLLWLFFAREELDRDPLTYLLTFLLLPAFLLLFFKEALARLRDWVRG